LAALAVEVAADVTVAAVAAATVVAELVAAAGDLSLAAQISLMQVA
jgi:hypothetical protein